MLDIMRAWNVLLGKEELLQSQNGALENHTMQDYRGNYPERDFLPFEGFATTSDNATVYPSPDVSIFNSHYFSCVSGTLSVDATTNGSDWISDMALTDLKSTTPGTKVLTIGAGDFAMLEGKFKQVRALQSGTANSFGRGHHGNK